MSGWISSPRREEKLSADRRAAAGAEAPPLHQERPEKTTSLSCSQAALTSDWAGLGLIDAGECNPTFGAGELSALTITNASQSLKSVFSSAASWLEETQSWTTARVPPLLWYEVGAPTI